MTNNMNETKQNPKNKIWVIILIITFSLIVLYILGVWLFQGVSGSLDSFGLEPSGSVPGSYNYSETKPTSYNESKTLLGESASLESSTGEESSERMVIKDASLSMVVSNIEDTGKKINTYAENNDGYIVSSQINNPLDQPRSYITVRVPAEKLDQAIDYYKTLADKVVSENITSEDITEKYVDLESKLKNYQATEEQLKEIMKKAQSVDEILKVQNQLTSVRQNIELIKGQMQYLEKNVDMAKISVTLAQDEASLPVISDKWQPLSQIKLAFRSVLSFLRWISYAIIWIVVFGIIWIPIWLIIKYKNRTKKN